MRPCWVRNAPDQSHHQCREKGNDVDGYSVRCGCPVHAFDVDEVFENLDERDARDRQGDLDLENAGVYVVKPLRAFRLVGDAEAVNEDAVPALHDHYDEVGDHARVHESKEHDHHLLHVPCPVPEHVAHESVVVDHEADNVKAEGQYQPDVDRVQKPAHREDRVTKPLCPEFAQITTSASTF